jgi:hypothetical protein
MIRVVNVGRAIGSVAAIVLTHALLMPLQATAVECGFGQISEKVPVQELEASYKINVGLDGDIFPFLAIYASMQPPQQRGWGTVVVTITNSTNKPVRNRIAVRIPGWSDQEIQMAEMTAGQVKTYKFAPTFLTRLYRNHEISPAIAMIEISDMGGRIVYQTTMPVRLRSVDAGYR